MSVSMADEIYYIYSGELCDGHDNVKLGCSHCCKCRGCVLIRAQNWLEQQFEYEYCAECHGDAEDHEVMVVTDLLFAHCKVNAKCHVENCQEHLG